MNRYDNNTFKYSNTYYTVFTTLYTKTGSPDDDMQISLDGADIEEISYENKLNQLVVKGNIIYTDRYAQVDKMIGEQYCYCELLFAEHKKKTDTDVGGGDIDENKKILHNFIVSNIKVIARNGSLIKYSIDLVSMNWFKCAANFSYSNYGKSPEPLFDIVKNCLSTNKLAIDAETFGNVKAPVSLNYMTQQNDNAFSTISYLLNRLYYFQEQRDDSLKFIAYDMFEDKYRLLDLKNKSTFIGSYATILSFFKTNNETLIQQEPTNIGSFNIAAPKTFLYANMFDKRMHGYDYNHDQMTLATIKSDETANLMNNRIDNGNYDLKYQKMFSSPNTEYFYSGMYWNNALNTYNDSITSLEENNSLILNITGQILRQPGSVNTLTLDRSIANLTSDDKKELEKMKKKYKAYEGIWFASKVKNIIKPAKPSFRQLLVLFRNFIPKLGPSV